MEMAARPEARHRFGRKDRIETSATTHALRCCCFCKEAAMKTLLVIVLGALMFVALSQPALGQRCLPFRPLAYYGGAYVAPAYPYPAYGYPVYPYYPYPLPPAPSLGFGRGGIYGHVFVGRDERITSYTFPGRDSWQ
jgi:hypothetical protein